MQVTREDKAVTSSWAPLGVLGCSCRCAGRRCGAVPNSASPVGGMAQGESCHGATVVPSDIARISGCSPPGQGIGFTSVVGVCILEQRSWQVGVVFALLMHIHVLKIVRVWYQLALYTSFKGVIDFTVG